MSSHANASIRQGGRSWLRRIHKFWRHAFAVGDVGEPDSDDLAALDRLASHIVIRRMEAPAILFLQSCVPLSYIGSQAMIGLEPIVGPFFPQSDWERLTRIFERRDGVERLLSRIETLAFERDTHGK